MIWVYTIKQSRADNYEINGDDTEFLVGPYYEFSADALDIKVLVFKTYREIIKGNNFTIELK